MQRGEIHLGIKSSEKEQLNGWQKGRILNPDKKVYCGDFVKFYCGICLEENSIFYPCKELDILLNHIHKKHSKQY